MTVDHKCFLISWQTAWYVQAFVIQSKIILGAELYHELMTKEQATYTIK